MSSSQTYQHKFVKNDKGMISIMTVMVLMTIITLIVIGFAQMSLRNQRTTLDRQLSTQAFYAAESGVNEARSLIQSAVASNPGVIIPDKTDCSSGPVFYNSLSPTIDASKGIKYSCLLVNASPTTLRYSDIGTNSVVVPLTSTSGANLSSIKLTLQTKDGSTPITGCPNSAVNAFTATTSWTCGYGVLRFDLVPVQGNGFTLDSLRTSAMTTFAVPVSPGGVAAIPYAGGASNINNLAPMQCTNTECNFTVNGLSKNSYYLRVSSLYKNVGMQITAKDVNGNAVSFANAQAVVDATGKAGDVLRRIQVNMPIRTSTSNQLSDYALETTDSICKRFSVMDNFYSNGASIPGATSRLCN